MRKRTIKIILAAVAVTAVLGVAVAAAATNQSSWTGGRGAQMTNTDRTTRNGDRLQLRARDGTGPRHCRREPARGRVWAPATARVRDTTRGLRAPEPARIVRIGAE